MSTPVPHREPPRFPDPRISLTPGQHHEAAIRNKLTDLLHQKGDSDGAMEQLKTAAAVLARIGNEPTGMLPKVWKLVEW